MLNHKMLARTFYNNLVGWWRLWAPSGKNLNAKFNLVVTGTPPAQTGPDGIASHASGLFSDSAYYSINFAVANAAFNTLMALRKDYIFDIWMYFTGTPTTGDIPLDYGAPEYYVRGTSTGGLQWVSGTFANSAQSTTNFISLNTWYRITIRATNGGNKKIYVNGVLNVNSNLTCVLPATTNRVVLGRWAGGGGGPFDVGYLSDAKLILGSSLADIPRGF